MKYETLVYQNSEWIKETSSINNPEDIDIVFIFGDREVFKCQEAYHGIKVLYPDSIVVGCTSSGNILGNRISQASMVATAVEFENGMVRMGIEDYEAGDDLEMVAQKLVSQLPLEELRHIFILSDGLNINGSELAKGVNQALKNSVPVTGGLAGDGTAFEETWVIGNAPARQNRIVAVGFYGEGISVTSGCFAGWDEFGVLRRITKSVGNVVYEIDGKPALELYKKYLGAYANELPGSGLRFPLSIKANEDDIPLVRTILSIDEEMQSLTFAGDMPEGFLARLMQTNIDGLIDGAQIAAQHIRQSNTKNALCLVVSCVGRRLILNQLADEELESVQDVLGDNVFMTGFYSYGELAPFSDQMVSCLLHNQTMTLTVIFE